MKKITFFFLLLSIVAMQACKKQDKGIWIKSGGGGSIDTIRIIQKGSEMMGYKIRDTIQALPYLQGRLSGRSFTGKFLNCYYGDTNVVKSYCPNMPLKRDLFLALTFSNNKDTLKGKHEVVTWHSSGCRIDVDTVPVSFIHLK